MIVNFKTSGEIKQQFGEVPCWKPDNRNAKVTKKGKYYYFEDGTKVDKKYLVYYPGRNIRHRTGEIHKITDASTCFRVKEYSDRVQCFAEYAEWDNCFCVGDEVQILPFEPRKTYSGVRTTVGQFKQIGKRFIIESINEDGHFVLQGVKGLWPECLLGASYV